MPKATAGTPAKRACDQCNYRRIKCNRALQCDRCTLSKLTCTYDKATKPRGGKRIKELQELGEREASNNNGETQAIPGLDNPAEGQSDPSSNGHAFGIPYQPVHRTSTSSFSMQHGVDASSATSASPGNLPNPLSAASHESGSSILPPISTFPDSPAASHHYLNSSGLPNVSNEPKRQHDPHNLHIQPEYGTSNTAGQNSTTSFFPSSIPSASFPADSFLTGLYDNIPPPPQQASDFSFLESWPFWLAGTAANSPESAQNNGMKEASADGTYHQSSSYMSTHNQPQEVDWLADSQLIPAIASFFEKLHPIMPIFTRSWILDRIDKDHHRSQPSLAAMLLALCSLAKIQPVKAADRISRSQRNEQARALLEQSVKVRANVLLGQTHSLDEVLASFYSFATLFGMQEHDAATFRLREAITLAQLMKLNVHESYMFLDHGEQERRLRTYWLLCITERAYALQRGDSIGLRGHPVTDMAFVVSGLPANSLSDFPQRQLRLFDNVDEAFVDCWHGRCSRASCSTFTRDRARLLHASFGAIFPEQIDGSSSTMKKISLWQREMIQSIDTTITSHWLQSRLWQICLSHELLSPSSQDIVFRPAFVLQCAYQAHHFHVAADASSREAHGVGLVEKLFDIGMALLQARGLASIDEALRSNIDQLLGLYIADLNNSSEEGRTFSDRLKADWQATGSAYAPR